MFIIHKGRDFFLTITVRRPNGQPLDLTNITVSCAVRDASKDGALLFYATVTKTDAANGKVLVKFSNTQTQSLKDGQVLQFDLKLQWADGTIKNYPPYPLEAKVVEPVTN